MSAIKIMILLFLALAGLPDIAPALSPDPVRRAVEQEYLQRAAEGAEKYRQGPAELVLKDRAGHPLAGATVRVEQLRHEFLFGSIIFDQLRGQGDPSREQAYKAAFAKIFNFAVFPFYWKGYEPEEGRPQWEAMTPLLEWCRSRGITTKGHPLVWTAPSGWPDWLDRYPPQETVELLQRRVTAVTAGFRDRIEIWDVYNEPVNTTAWGYQGREFWVDDRPLEESSPLVEQAFHWAERGNPSAHLILNEFYTITKPNTRERFHALVKGLLEKGTPIRGLGIQGHEPRQYWYDPREVWADFDRLGEFGLPLHLTEVTFTSSGDTLRGWRAGEGVWDEQTQAECIEHFLRLAFGHPAVASFNFWGFSDRAVWLKKGGLVDENYHPKPAYEIVDSLVNREWHTSLAGRTDGQGKLSFRGFHGDYRVEVTTADGRVRRWELPLRSDRENRWVLLVK